MKPENTNQNQINQAVLQQLDNASRIVEGWPPWKQGILATSSLTANSAPRTTDTTNVANSNTERE